MGEAAVWCRNERRVRARPTRIPASSYVGDARHDGTNRDRAVPRSPCNKSDPRSRFLRPIGRRAPRRAPESLVSWSSLEQSRQIGLRRRGDGRSCIPGHSSTCCRGTRDPGVLTLGQSASPHSELLASRPRSAQQGASPPRQQGMRADALLDHPIRPG